MARTEPHAPRAADLADDIRFVAERLQALSAALKGAPDDAAVVRGVHSALLHEEDEIVGVKKAAHRLAQEIEARNGALIGAAHK